MAFYSGKIFKNNKPTQCNDGESVLPRLPNEAKLSQEEKMLRTLCVRLLHDVLPQHKIESRSGSRVPTPAEIEKFKEFASLKRGPYSQSEDEIIVANWRTFAKRHDWDVKNFAPFLLFRDANISYITHKHTRHKFVQFLANGLPNRTLYSVYHRFRVLFGNKIIRRYTKVEDEVIIEHLEHNPDLDESRKLSDLAKKLSRTRQSIWRRYERLKKQRQLKLAE